MTPRRSTPGVRPAGPPNPFEACLLIACIAQGFAAAAGWAQPAAFHDVLPGWAQIVWGALMAIGGAAAVTGLFWPGDPVDGILIKRVGLVALAPLTIAYGLAGVFTDPPGRIVSSLFGVAFGIACLWRIRQVTLAIAGLRRDLRMLREEWRHDGEIP